MEQEKFNELVQSFFEALRRKSLLIIIDTASKNSRAVFSLVSFNGDKYINYSNMLSELGFRNYGKEDDLFITHCAGRFSLYILDNIGDELKGNGIQLPEDFYEIIQSQQCI